MNKADLLPSTLSRLGRTAISVICVSSLASVTSTSIGGNAPINFLMAA
ncbi:hypothetical protein [Rahnella woolbedingensis]|nr:hypothetical protein [Rahnella woolbedingensis]